MVFLFPIRILAAVAVAILIAGRGLGQGTFSMSSAKGAKPRVTLSDGTVASGSGYRVESLVLNPATGSFQGGFKPPATLFAGANAGLFSAGTITVPFVPPGRVATIKIRAWQATGDEGYDQSALRGETTFDIVLGGVVDPGTGIPSLAADIVPAYQGIVLESVPKDPFPFEPHPSEIRWLDGQPYLAFPWLGDVIWYWQGDYATIHYHVAVGNDYNSIGKVGRATEVNVFPRPSSGPDTLFVYQNLRIIDHFAYLPLITTNRPAGFYRVYVQFRFGPF